MTKYNVRFFWGDYSDRQNAANAAKAVCYVEQHFNSATPAATGVEVIVGKNASKKSKDWAALYAEKVSKEFLIPVRSPETKGVIVGGRGGRGDGNIRLTNMPAILLEPCFVSNPKEALIVRSTSGQKALGKILAETIQTMFPDGGTIAFSVGHKGKESNPHDRGADVYGGGTEAEYAELVMLQAKAVLEGVEMVDPDPIAAARADIESGNVLSEREEMAGFILNFEARRDSHGNLTVYKLPAGDGGGAYEVAGINQRYDPKAAPRLKAMIEARQYDAAEHYAREYIAGNTDPVRAWFDTPSGGNTGDDYPSIECYLRDTIFNRGATGCAKILQKALKVQVDGAFGKDSRAAFQAALANDWRGLLTDIRNAREWYERNVVKRDESSIFWKGLVNRWNNALEKALSFA